MARLWTCGFELQSATAGVEFSIVNGAPTISTTVHRAGAAALRSNPTAGTQYAEHQIDPGTVKRTLHRFYLRIGSLPSADCNIYGIGQSGYFPGLVRLTTTGALTLRDGFTSTNLGTPSAPLVTGRWYRVELDYTDTAGTAGSVTGAFKGYLDGVLFADTLCSNINGWSRIRAGVQSAATADIYIDDIAVNDTTGSVQNGLPGPGSVVHLRPDSAGDAAGWATTVGGTANWQRVSETTPDDATTYNATTAAGTTAADDFNLGSSAAAGIGANDSITLVQVGGRIGSDAATAASLVYRIKGQSGGTVTESASVSVALTGWATHKAAAPYPYQLTAYTNPQTGTAWTPAALDTAQIGYRANVSQATTRRVSTLWALVEFQPLTTAALGTASESGTAQALARSKAWALAMATETGTAQALVPLTATPLAELVDDFDDNTLDTALWPNSFGAVSETGGRARVPCTTDYNAYSSALAYTLAGSSVYLRAYAPAGGGATTEAWAQMLIKSSTEGTDLGFELRMTTGELVCFSRTGYFDPGEVDIPYSATDHAWLRVRESGGTTYWDTSPDGTAWTNRRAETSPSWVGDIDLEFQLIAHRSDGVDDFAEFDNVNTGGGQGAALTTSVETSTAQALAGRKVQALGVATETDSAQTPARARSRALTPAAATETGQALARTKRRTPGLAAASDAGQTLAGAKRTAMGPAVETETGQALARAKRRSGTPAAETDTGQLVTRRKTRLADSALEMSTARPVVGAKRLALGAAEETSTAREVAGASGLQLAEETSTARSLGRAKTRSMGVAGEVGTARPFGQAKAATLDRVTETATARPLTGGRSRALTPAEETWTARLLGTARARQLPTATATDEALGLTAVSAGQLPTAAETDTARPATGRKTQPLAATAVVEAAQPLAGRKTQALGAAAETDAARTPGAAKRFALGTADETADAQRLLIPGSAAPAEETLSARLLARAKRAALPTVAALDEAQPLGSRSTQQLGRAAEADEGVPAGRRKARALALVGATTTARSLLAGKTVVLGVALETDRALIGPKIRLTQAIDRTEALALTGQRQRPADALDASTTGPTLSASTSGPALTTSSSGPHLVASSTGGG
ncbi:hypothetical protein ACIQSP_16415 [Streptomyces nigra]|uniref:hypothetical protein n=1 Tax=Streptomyces nigra TaxID=1827580 RepID=UPI00381F711C